MNKTYYLAQIIEDVGGVGNIFSYCAFVGIFTTRKNAEDAVCKILAKMHNTTIDYTDYSAEADFLDEYFYEYMIDTIETDKIYY